MGINFDNGPIRGRGFLIPATDDPAADRAAIARAIRRIADEAKRVTPISTVTPEQMAEHLRSCTCLLGSERVAHDVDEGWDR